MSTPADLSDPRVFASVYLRHRRAVMASARRIVRDRELAEDLAQDVFAWLWSHPHAYDGRASLGAFLALVARSRAIDAERSADARVRLEQRLRDERPPAADAPIDRLLGREDAAVLRALVSRLPETQREALALAYWAGLSIDAVAARLGVPYDTAKSRVRLARERLATRVCAAGA